MECHYLVESVYVFFSFTKPALVVSFKNFIVKQYCPQFHLFKLLLLTESV